MSFSVSGLFGGLAHVRQAWLRCLRCCPGVAVTILGLPSHRARGGYGQHLQICSLMSNPDDTDADLPDPDAALGRPEGRVDQFAMPRTVVGLQVSVGVGCCPGAMIVL